MLTARAGGTAVPLEPLPETREALLRMSLDWHRDLTAELITQGELVEAIVPTLVGLSLALVRDGPASTLAAALEQVAVMDAVQHAVG